MVYWAISIEVVTSKPQAYVMRPKGSVGNCIFILVQKELSISYPLVIRSVWKWIPSDCKQFLVVIKWEKIYVLYLFLFSA